MIVFVFTHADVLYTMSAFIEPPAAVGPFWLKAASFCEIRSIEVNLKEVR